MGLTQVGHYLTHDDRNRSMDRSSACSLNRCPGKQLGAEWNPTNGTQYLVAGLYTETFLCKVSDINMYVYIYIQYISLYQYDNYVT